MEKIKINMDLSDQIEDIKDKTEKADFVLGKIQSDFTGWLTNTESLKAWNDNRDMIAKMIDIASDYVTDASDGLRELLGSTSITSRHGEESGVKDGSS